MDSRQVPWLNSWNSERQSGFQTCPLVEQLWYWETIWFSDTHLGWTVESSLLILSETDTLSQVWVFLMMEKLWRNRLSHFLDMVSNIYEACMFSSGYVWTPNTISFLNLKGFRPPISSMNILKKLFVWLFLGTIVP